jgi:hypothetical protein
MISMLVTITPAVFTMVTIAYGYKNRETAAHYGQQ